jgi:hypothetical protein
MGVKISNLPVMPSLSLEDEFPVNDNSELTAGNKTKRATVAQLVALVEESVGTEMFLGVYADLTALETANPTAIVGQYAQVDAGSGSDVITYYWDTDEGWIPGGTGGPAMPLYTGTGANTDGPMDQNSITNAIASAQSSAQAYADGLVVGLWDDRGNFDASVNAYPTTGGSGPDGAIKKGDVYLIVVGGTFPTGQVVNIGDSVRALIDSPANLQANWAIQKNGGAFNPTTATIGTITPVNTPRACSNKVVCSFTFL